MIRTDATYQMLKAMQTIKQVGGDFRDVVMEIHGMYDKNAGSLERLGGKLTTTMTTAKVWSINQLRFRDSNAIVNRCGSTILGAFGSPRYGGAAKFKLPPWQTPPDPPVPDQNDPDFLPPKPEPDNIKQFSQKQEDQGNPTMEQPKVKPANDMMKIDQIDQRLQMVITPATLIFNADLGTAMESFQFFNVSFIDPVSGNTVEVYDKDSLVLKFDMSLPPNVVMTHSEGSGSEILYGVDTVKPSSDYLVTSLVFPPLFANGTNDYNTTIRLKSRVSSNSVIGSDGVELKGIITVRTIKTVIPDYTGPLKCKFRLDGKQPPQWQEGNVTMAYDAGNERWFGSFGDLTGFIYPPNSANNASADWRTTMTITARGTYSGIISGVTLRPADGYPSGDTGVQAMVGDPFAPPAAEAELIFGPSVF